jgi:hypothetical protein
MAAAAAGGIGLACGLDMSGLGDVADGGDDAASGDVVVSAEGAGEGSPGKDASVGGESGADGAAESGAGEAAVDGPAEAHDATPPPPDAPCTGVTCNGACSNATDCTACSGAPLLCGATKTCGADCSACPSSPIECFACDTTRRNPIGTCDPNDPQSYCLNTSYATAYNGGPGEHCACNAPTDCPGQNQVCISVGGTLQFGCFTCGEAYTQAAQCASGGNCNAQQAVCH